MKISLVGTRTNKIKGSEYSYTGSSRYRTRTSMERKHKPKKSNDDKQIKENEIFDKIKQKIELKFKNKNKQEKALKRLERLQKYMCEQDSKGLKDIKSKMMNDLTNYYEKGDK